MASLLFCTSFGRHSQIPVTDNETPASYDLHLLFDDHSVWPITLDPLSNRLHGRLQVAAAIADHGAADHGLLPLVLQVQLGHRDIELAPQPAHQRLDAAAF